MTYKDLTIHQRISLKGFFHTDDKLTQYKALMLLFGFITAVNYFLTGDINILYRELDRQAERNDWKFA